MSEYTTKYTAELEELGVTVDSALLESIISMLKSILGNRDAANVAASDPAELATVKKNFVEGKLGVTGTDADAAIDAVCATMAGDRTKSRVVFYYLLCQELGKTL